MKSSLDIPLNVTRTRITVLGFMMSVILFSMGAMSNFQDEQMRQILGNNLKIVIPLFFGFAFAFVSMGLYLVSQNTRQEGDSEIWFYSYGDIVLYIALSQTIGGVLLLFMSIFSYVLIKDPNSLFQVTHPEKFQSIADTLYTSIFWVAAIAWFATVYLFPIFSFYRNPLPQHKTWILYISYFFLLFIVFGITGYLYHLFVYDSLDDPGKVLPFVGQAIQPILWR